MIRLRRQILLNAFKLFDLTIMVFSLFLTAAAVSDRIQLTSFGRFLTTLLEVRTFICFLIFLLVWHILFSACGLYRSRRLSDRWGECSAVLSATFFGTLALWILAGSLGIGLVTARFALLFWVVSSVIAIGCRLLLRRGLAWVRCRGRNLRLVLILGTNQQAVALARKITENPGLGYHLIGFIDEEWAGTETFSKAGYPLLTDFKGFAAIVRQRVVDEVWVALPMQHHYQEISDIIGFCQKLGITTRFFPFIFDPKLAHLKAEQFDGRPVMTHYPAAMGGGLSLLAKRSIDILLSVIFLIVFSPFFLVAAVLIKSTSPGPVFFVQDRLGLNKRRFRLYKFRTMIRDAEQQLAQLEPFNEVEGPVFKIRDDPRITKVGKFLRRTSIDELPQLFNVLRGDMSLVGPRPLPVRDYEGFYEDAHRRRFSVRPGLTCLWQINGRNAIPFEKWMELDLQYIDQWSLWLDFKILLKTTPSVLRGSGAA